MGNFRRTEHAEVKSAKYMRGDRYAENLANLNIQFLIRASVIPIERVFGESMRLHYRNYVHINA